MRIIAGTLRNRKIASPQGRDGIRPTGEKIREAVFNMLYSKVNISEKVFADICCGTGAMGIEALSRGAKFCTFIDSDTKNISYNVKNLDITENLKILRAPAQKVCITDLADVIFLDPPYFKDIAEAILKNHQAIGKQGAMWIVEVEKQKELGINLEHFKITDDRLYGKSRIYVLEQLV
ncbi:MAG: methyltransferase [Proteobacteria bacterium]|nr:methyltransferase [Pseudomonadota bacterium]